MQSIPVPDPAPWDKPVPPPEPVRAWAAVLMPDGTTHQVEFTDRTAIAMIVQGVRKAREYQDKADRAPLEEANWLAHAKYLQR